MRRTNGLKSIAFIIPYFTNGSATMPEMTQLWFDSCQQNPTIDFFIYTDCDLEKFTYPSNVKVFDMTFNELKKKIQKRFNFLITLDNPYKLCDFKPTYGEVFQEILSPYDFWGFCDIDLIWGDIRKFITTEILETYERILTRGHCSIFKNNSEINSGYRLLDNKSYPDYKDVFSSSQSFAFDEWPGYTSIQKLNGVKIYDEAICADIQTNRYLLHTTREKYPQYIEEKKHKHTIFEIKSGKVKSYSLINSSKDVFVNEYLYIHLQKRELVLDQKLDKLNYLIVSPNRAIQSIENLSYEKIRDLSKNNWWTWNLRGQFKRFLHNIKSVIRNLNI